MFSFVILCSYHASFPFSYPFVTPAFPSFRQALSGKHQSSFLRTGSLPLKKLSRLPTLPCIHTLYTGHLCWSTVPPDILHWSYDMYIGHHCCPSLPCYIYDTCFFFHAMYIPEGLHCSSVWYIYIYDILRDFRFIVCCTRFFILPWDIPGRYYPLFLATLFSVMRGSWKDLFCAVGVGYAYADVSQVKSNQMKPIRIQSRQIYSGQSKRHQITWKEEVKIRLFQRMTMLNRVKSCQARSIKSSQFKSNLIKVNHAKSCQIKSNQ